MADGFLNIQVVTDVAIPGDTDQLVEHQDLIYDEIERIRLRHNNGLVDELTDFIDKLDDTSEDDYDRAMGIV